MKQPIRIIGAGLAGSEAAWQCARRSVAVRLFEMRPLRSTPAHQTANFAELVCSNSLKSDTENTAPWLLKEEVRRAGSLLMEIAQRTAVPAGHALAVDREKFAAAVTAAIERDSARRTAEREVSNLRNRFETLSPREQQVLRLTAEGKSNKEVATLLHLEVHTVRSYRKSLMAKLGASNVAQLIQVAAAAGMLDRIKSNHSDSE